MDTGMAEKRYILIVEDDKILNEGISFALKKEGYITYSAYTLAEAVFYLKQNMDLILLDINLPDGDGRDFLRNILAGHPVPILLLTARDSEEDMIKGFEAGCDDYITKPFSMPVLIMKLRAVLRRSMETSRRIYLSENLIYDFEKKQLKKRENIVELTALEIKLLEIFLINRNIVLTRENILDKIWDADERFVEDKTLNVNIRRLREKIEDNPGEPEYIKTVFGIGYKWKDENRGMHNNGTG